MDWHVSSVPVSGAYSLTLSLYASLSLCPEYLPNTYSFTPALRQAYSSVIIVSWPNAYSFTPALRKAYPSIPNMPLPNTYFFTPSLSQACQISLWQSPILSALRQAYPRVPSKPLKITNSFGLSPSLSQRAKEALAKHLFFHAIPSHQPLQVSSPIFPPGTAEHYVPRHLRVFN